MDETENIDENDEPNTEETPAVGNGQEVSAEKAESGIATPAVPHHSWVYHVFNFLLGKETRLGRVMRPFLRWTAAVVGLFALGLLAGYLLLYQPTQKGFDSANVQIAQAQTDMNTLKAQVAGLQSTLTSANQAIKAAQDETKMAQARNNLLIVVYDVANARTYLAQKDGAKLINALDKARADLDVVQPYIIGTKKELSDELNSRMETVRSVVVRDATLAQSDLENLYTALLTANDVLFGAKP
jgi:hypothetical protein